MKMRVFLAAAALLACCLPAMPAGARTDYDRTIHDFITQSQQRELARAALAQYGIVADTGHGPEVDVRLVFPASQTGLDNIEMTMLEPVSSGAHECMSIAVKTGGTVIESYFHAKKDARPGHMYDVVVSDSMGDKFWVGRILVSRQSVQRYVIHAPLLTPGSPHYGGPLSAPLPKLGIFTQSITPAFLRSAGVHNARAHGVLVLALWPNGAAQRAGLRVGDVIVGFNGRPVASLDDITRLEQTASGIELTIVRNGGALRLALQSSKLMTLGAYISSSMVPVPSMGMNVLPITPELIRLYPDPQRYAGVQGIIITNVAANGWASSAGLRPEDVVYAVNGHAVTTLQNFLQLVSQFANALQFSLYRGGQAITLGGPSSGWQPPTVGPGFVPPATPRPSSARPLVYGSHVLKP